jgi:hypothetical protein
MTKVCSKCGIEKDLCEFNKQKLGKLGHRADCRACQSSFNSAYKKTDSGKQANRRYKKSEKGVACRKKYSDSPKTKAKQHEYHISEKYRANRRKRADAERFGGNRELVLERDGHCCVFCGSSDKLQVHHIDGKGRNLPPDKQNNDLNNLITLCAACHINVHNPIEARYANRRCGDAI